MSRLTVGIPTYNRRDSLARILGDLAAWPDVVVVDDGSQDGTDALLRNTGISWVQHDGNLGYSTAFLRLFEECETEYLMVAADDDRVHLDVVNELAAWLVNERPDFVSPQWRRSDGSLYRGREERRQISVEEFRAASGHAPGLTYRVDAVRDVLKSVDELAQAGDESATVYPQILVVASLLADDADCRWWDRAPVTEGAAATSRIMSTTGGHYSSVSARIAQHASLANYLDRLDNETMREQHRGWFYGMLRSAVPESLRDELDAGAARYLLTQKRATLAETFRKLMVKRLFTVR